MDKYKIELMAVEEFVKVTNLDKEIINKKIEKGSLKTQKVVGHPHIELGSHAKILIARNDPDRKKRIRKPSSLTHTMNNGVTYFGTMGDFCRKN